MLIESAAWGLGMYNMLKNMSKKIIEEKYEK